MDLDLERLERILSPYIVLRRNADIVSVSDALALKTGLSREEIREYLDAWCPELDSAGRRYHFLKLPGKADGGFECTCTTTSISDTEILAFSENGAPGAGGDAAVVPEALAAMARYSASSCLIVARGVIIHANEAFIELTGYPGPEVIGKQLIGIVSRQSRETFIGACQQGLEDPEGIIPPVDIMLTPLSGKRIFVNMRGGWLRSSGGEYLWMTLNDITDQVILMRRLQEQERRFSDLFDISPIGLLYVDPRGIITSCNAFVGNLMGYDRAEIQGSAFTRFVAPGEEQRLRDEFRDLFEQGREIQQRECVLRTGTGEEVTIQYDVQVISRKRRNVLALMVFSDITGKKKLEMELMEKNAEMEKTLWEMAEVKDALEARAGELNRATEELKVLNERLSQLSITDGLTDIYNHRHFQDRLSEEMERVQRSKDGVLSLLILDIDDFKHFNDTYGHQCGDMVLKQLAGVLKKCVRSIDILARYGGEEFAVILPNTHAKDAETVARRICDTIRSTPLSFGSGISVKVTVSIGVGAIGRGQGDKSELVRRADSALYAAKAKWKDRVEVWEED
ncbi:MAG TPA: sensor domain-containing diguanylate cyclase [Deltaproteobacteria bacterium]|nr:sensor domain-containing diguanylate cyclase [Deltaproteobacteria bacterium]